MNEIKVPASEVVEALFTLANIDANVFHGLILSMPECLPQYFRKHGMAAIKPVRKPKVDKGKRQGGS